jgi:hypothetical protein
MADDKTAKTQGLADFKCGQDVVIFSADHKLTKTRIYAKNTMDRLKEGKTLTVYEYFVEGIEKKVEPNVDFFANEADLMASVK